MKKTERYNWNPLNEFEGEFCWIPIDDLVMDPSYQRNDRERSQESILRIAREWDWELCKVISVSVRDGKNFVTDGFTRTTAARRRGDIIALPCLVFNSHGRAKEAADFVNHAKVRPQTAFNVYRAQLAAGSKLHLQLQEQLMQAGFCVKDSRAINAISFPKQLVTHFRVNPDLCIQALCVERSMVGDVKLAHDIHKGVFYVLRKQLPEGADLRDVADRALAQGGHEAIKGSIASVAIQSQAKAVSERIAGIGVLAVVNKRLQKRVMLPPPTANEI